MIPQQAGQPSDASAQPGTTVGEHARRWWQGVRAGDLGSLPIVLGLLVIVIIFQLQNDRFLTAGNLVNLIVQAAGITAIAMGMVFVLLLGEIDLSVGYVSGVTAGIAALLLLPGGAELPAVAALALAIGAGASIGAVHGLIITRIGVPSFVVTLAGLLGWHGMVLLLVGRRGTIAIQDSTVVSIANGFVAPSTGWALLGAAIALYAATSIARRRTRLGAGLPAEPRLLLAIRIGAAAAAGTAVVWVANADRGIPFVLVVLAVLFVLWSHVLTRTAFGRWVYAIGGNIEAARRAGIDTDRIRIACFAICSAMAAVGGIILASRLRSVGAGAGGGPLLLHAIAAAVIGGTSLFGGHGHVRSAVLGALVIASIDNGLGLIGLGSGEKFVITGLVLLAAATVDSLARGRGHR